MQTVILLFQCEDKKGIVASISNFILKHNGNIITADQHSTDPQGGYFFIRVEFFISADEVFFDIVKEDFKLVATGFNADWQMYKKSDQMKMGILVSRPDHCLVDLLYLWRSGDLAVKIPFVISNYEEHRDIVVQNGIKFYYIPVTKENKKEDEILKVVLYDSDFLVLARYMQILSVDFLKDYAKDIINIHHSFLPSFKGSNPYKQAFEKGVKIIGATAHFVTQDLDEGPIVSQIVEAVSHKDSINDLIRKGKNLEKRALSQAIHNYIDHRVIKLKHKTICF